MTARHATALLLFLLVVIHAQLWFGRGSVLQVRSMQTQLVEQKAANKDAHIRNSQLEAEVRDLREGLEMVEEKARMELGMVKPNEVFVQVVRKP
jgi:cell division protein FtsB